MSTNFEDKGHFVAVKEAIVYIVSPQKKY